jgi:hypothetical protein
LVFELLNECKDWDCDPDISYVNQSPYWDNIRFGVARDVVAVGEPSREVEPGIRQLTCAPTPSGRPATIRYELSTDARVRLAVYGVAGAEVRKLLEGAFRQRGTHTVRWDGTDGRGIPVAPGVYLVRLEAAGEVRVTKTVFSK